MNIVNFEIRFEIRFLSELFFFSPLTVVLQGNHLWAFTKIVWLLKHWVITSTFYCYFFTVATKLFVNIRTVCL